MKSFISNLWKYVLVIVITTAICASVTAYYDKYIAEEKYEAGSTLFVFYQTIEKPEYIYQQMMANGMLAKDYKDIIKSRPIMDKVKDRIKKELPEASNISTSEISDSISVSTKTDSRLINITVKNSNPKLAEKIANITSSVFKDTAADLIKIDNVSIIEPAITPSSPISPTPKKDILMSAAAGFCGGLGLIILIEYLRRSLKKLNTQA